MKKIGRKYSVASFLLLIFTLTSSFVYAQADTKGLQDRYRNYFDIGVSVTPWSVKNDEAALLLTEFNSLTAENAMKMGPIHPRSDHYNWAPADSIAAFARKNGLKMRGHALIWHQQTPAWFFTNEKGDTVSREVLLTRMREHITAVVNRYKDVVYAWDVVNEAISDTRSEFYRSSAFYRIIGEEFIEKAFEWAHAADTSALLFYNDYNEIDSIKRGKIIQLIGRLKQKGIPIHGAGLQAHWAINEPTEQQLEKTLADFAATGLILHITELDISVYPKEHQARNKKPTDTDTVFSAQKEQQQLALYKMVFEKFRKYHAAIHSVTFWNISDRHSWLDNFPVQGRKDYPLLFDKNLKRKKAYYVVGEW